jgi:glutathione S-transferase
MITLYQRSDCPFCWKVRITLAELGLEYLVIDNQLGEKPPALSALSPTGTVPVLVDGDAVIWDSAVIVEYLDSRYGGNRLFGSDPLLQVIIRQLHVYSDKIAGGSLRNLVFEKRSKPESQWNRDVITRGESEWNACMAWLESQLGDMPWFGRNFSAADCAIAARFGVAEAYGAGVGEEFPGLSAWFHAVKEREAWSLAYPTSFIRSQ